MTSRADLETSLAETEDLESEVNKGNSDHTGLHHNLHHLHHHRASVLLTEQIEDLLI